MNYEEMIKLAKILAAYKKAGLNIISEDSKEEDLHTDIYNLVDSYLNGSDEEYWKIIDSLEDKKEIIAEALRDIVSDLDSEYDCDDKEEPIDLLLAGEELELDDDELNEVIEELNNRFDSYAIFINDGKVSVKVK